MPVAEAELRLAEILVEEMLGVQPAELHEEYGRALEELVTPRLTGGELAETPQPQRSRPQTSWQPWRKASAAPDGTGEAPADRPRIPPGAMPELPSPPAAAQVRGPPRIRPATGVLP
ncbi:hypothetical protein ABT112_32565 [Streptomyces sp. NPDC002055]|uniref:hypothetical protein n=1 Tax=Streptomyces sp. NPDC002055 TaxID=3154534 RepID=UPI003325BD5C